MRKITVLFLVVLLLSHHGEASPDKAAKADTVLELAVKTREARLAGNTADWLKYGLQTLRLAPDHPDFLISVARAFAANGQIEQSISHLADAIRRGAAFEIAAFPEFAEFSDNTKLKDLAARALQNRVSVANGEIYKVIEDAGLRPEGITYDPQTSRLFIGSRRGEIWQIDKSGDLTRMIGGTGLREVYGLKVDQRRRLLWAITGVFPDFIPTGEPKKDVGIAGVHVYHLDTQKLIQEYWLDERPTQHGFNDLALANNGSAYITDSTQNCIFKIDIDRKKLERFFCNPGLSGPNGLALTPDDRRLYIAHIEGITMIDTETRAYTRLRMPADVSIHGIDGLVYDRDSLIGVQGSPYLSRVIRIHLSDRADAVTSVTILNSFHPKDFGQTTAVIAEGSLFVVTARPLNPQKDDPQSQFPRIVRIPISQSRT